MKILVLMVLLFVSQTNASSDKKYIPVPARAPNMSAAQILNWKQFQTLPVEKKIEYFDALKDFLIKEENKWPGKKMASLSDLLFPLADAEEPSCPDYDKSTPEVKSNIAKNGKYCIKAGFLVCVTVTGGCSSSDPDYLTKSKKYCIGVDAGKMPCAPPLFLKKDGSPLCVDGALARKNKSVTQTCINAQNDLKVTDDEYRKLINSNIDKYKAEYEELRSNILGYCKADNGNKWKYDSQDCTDLTTQLGKVAPTTLGMPKGEVKNDTTNHYVCKGKYTIPASKDIKDDKETIIDVDLIQSDTLPKNYFVLGLTDEKWTETECDPFGRIVNINSGGNPQRNESGKYDANYKPCLARVVGGQKETLHFEGVATNDASSCKLHFSRYQDGKPDSSKKDPSCIMPDGSTPLIPDPTKLTLAKTAALGPKDYQLKEANGTVEDLFISKDTSKDVTCWERATNIISPINEAAPPADAQNGEVKANTEKPAAK